MRTIRFYPDFSKAAVNNDQEQDFLDMLLSVNKSCKARFTNFMVFDYDTDPSETEYFLTYPSDWLMRYLTNGYSRLDPQLDLDFRQHGFVDWQEYQDKHNEPYFEAMAEFGVAVNSVSLACHINKRRLGVLNLMFADDNPDWETFKYDSLDLFKHECERAVAQYQLCFFQNLRQKIALTPREKECLYWAAIGKTDEQIADLLGTSKWTVNSQFQNAKTKLGAPNRTSAVATAISQRLIEIKHAG